MSESGAYGRRLADRLHSESFRSLVSRTLRRGVGGDLRHEPGNAVDDPIVRALMSVLYLALDQPDQTNRLFVDCIMLALGCHLAQIYGGLETIPTRGGLAPWQQRRAKEIIEANLDGEVPLTELARECGLSTGHFSRAFKDTMGIPPHQWLLRRRIENAMRLLRNQQLPLPEVALACGFSDQSHFTRVFTKLCGTSPGAWRRLHQDNSAMNPRVSPNDHKLSKNGEM
jgi:AraC family transcriptional regulator